MRPLFIFIFAALVSIPCYAKLERHSFVQNDDWRQELVDIDCQIKKLTYKINRILSRAEWMDDQADRWQFRHGRLIESREAWNRAQQERERAQEIQKQIDILQLRRDEILQTHRGQ